MKEVEAGVEKRKKADDQELPLVLLCEAEEKLEYPATERRLVGFGKRIHCC